MGITNISWVQYTMNWWHGCAKVSPACKNCYAESVDRRWGDPHWGVDKPRKFMADDYWSKPLAWDRKAAKLGERHTVFCGSMMDWAEDRPDLEVHRARGWDLIARTPNLIWLMLTKRPENLWIVPWGVCGVTPDQYIAGQRSSPETAAPWPNVWGGVTTESQYYLDVRLTSLLGVNDAAPRARFVKTFASYEPALAPVKFDGTHPQGSMLDPLRDWLRPQVVYSYARNGDESTVTHPALDWVICGDESGPGRRAADIAWIRDVRDQCASAGAMFHFKQWCGAEVGGVGGERVKGKIHLPVLDQRVHDDRP